MVKCQNAGMKATWVMTDEEKQEKKEAALAKKRLKEISGNFSFPTLVPGIFFFSLTIVFATFKLNLSN